jgi:hypothetical protein
MKPRTPLLPGNDPLPQILSQEHLMAISFQPPEHLPGQNDVRTGVADEYPGHRPSRASVTSRFSLPGRVYSRARREAVDSHGALDDPAYDVTEAQSLGAVSVRW